MGLDIYFARAKKKEWREYSKGEPVDLYSTFKTGDPNSNEVVSTYPGEADGCPAMWNLGYFRNRYDLLEDDYIEMCIYEVPLEKVKEWYKNLKDEESYIGNWLLCILSTFTDDDVLLVFYY